MHPKSWLCCILLLLLPLTAGAEKPKDAALRELLTISGTEKQLEQLPLIIEDGFTRANQTKDPSQRLPDDLMREMKSSMHDAFAVTTLKEIALSELRGSLTDGDAKELLGWFRSPLGRRIARLEEDASTPEGVAESQKYASQIQNSPSLGARLAILKELDDAAKISENSVEIAVGTEVAVSLAIASTIPEDRRPSIEDIRGQLEKDRLNLETIVRSASLASLLYTYRSLTDQELKQLLTFAVSPTGSKFSSAQFALFKKIVIEGATRWGKSIGEAIKCMPAQGGA